ncbi:hypothetical protein M885DRAFT_521284 [Pelagophyceae sp. CCMP2097]|nr:hypothetical protein M885DRAFT_521284 [Pelagophyceae sp. CCMP2097]|mmetsp:Transcript_3766/g.11474  ORF Transcript_3766/g.11474 Transcript_3766/m.11474 type:complete len:242 (-) Transcript_3766:931-1656(-)
MLFAPPRRGRQARSRVVVRLGDIGTGLIETIETLDVPAAPALALGQYLLVAALLAAAAGTVSAQQPRARLGPAPMYVVNWSSPRETVYEDARGSARIMAVGDNAENVDDVLGAVALVKRLDKAVPGRGPLRYTVRKVFRDALGAVVNDTAVAPFSGVAAPPDDGAIDDDFKALLASRRQPPTLRDTLKRDGITLVQVGGEGGETPCKFCAGRGTRLQFNVRAACTYCKGAGYDATENDFDR